MLRGNSRSGQRREIFPNSWKSLPSDTTARLKLRLSRAERRSGKDLRCCRVFPEQENLYRHPLAGLFRGARDHVRFVVEPQSAAFLKHFLSRFKVTVVLDDF